jgi:hypothetical protein
MDQDLDYIRRKSVAARQFDCAVGPAVFVLRLPTKLESSIAYANAQTGLDRAGGLRFERALAELAVVGWSGVLVGHVLAAHPGEEPLVFEPGAAGLLFDAQPQWEAVILQALMDKVAARQLVEDTAAKN